jgi:hypothetical protein
MIVGMHGISEKRYFILHYKLRSIYYKYVYIYYSSIYICKPDLPAEVVGAVDKAHQLDDALHLVQVPQLVCSITRGQATAHKPGVRACQIIKPVSRKKAWPS